MEFSLVNRGLFVAVQKFNGIFDGENVNGIFLVHFVDDRGQRRRFAGAGWAGDQDDAVFEFADFH